MTTRTVASLLLLAFGACAHRAAPNVNGAQRALARELVARGDWARAFSVADALCRSSPRDPEGFLLRGVVYRERNLPVEAEGDLKEAIRLDDRSARAHSALAILFDAQRRADDAVEHHRRAADLEPSNAQYLNNLGFSLFVHGRAREAIEFLQRAVRSAPGDARIRNNLGFTYAAMGDMTRAAEQFAYGGTPAEARTNLGWAYERRGALAQAFELYVDALRMDPGAGPARKNLARVARDLGREAPPELAAPPGA